MTTTKPALSEFKPGRCFMGRIPHGQDLIRFVEAFCTEARIQTAAFSLIGAVSSAAFGAYDQKQQVYITAREDAALEIAACMGNVSLKEGHPFVHAHILLADEQGKTLGGHLFSETTIYAGEIYLQELTGEPPERVYDEVTGLMLWKV